MYYAQSAHQSNAHQSKAHQSKAHRSKAHQSKAHQSKVLPKQDAFTRFKTRLPPPLQIFWHSPCRIPAGVTSAHTRHICMGGTQPPESAYTDQSKAGHASWRSVLSPPLFQTTF
eukprot:365305-Chlamydomonas_euryale.AAC.6